MGNHFAPDVRCHSSSQWLKTSAAMEEKLILKNNLKEIRAKKISLKRSLQKQLVYHEIQSARLKPDNLISPLNLPWFYGLRR